MAAVRMQIYYAHLRIYSYDLYDLCCRNAPSYPPPIRKVYFPNFADVHGSNAHHTPCAGADDAFFTLMMGESSSDSAPASQEWVEKGRRKLGHFAGVEDWIIIWTRK